MDNQTQKEPDFIPDRKENQALGKAVKLVQQEIENEANVSDIPITYLKNGYLVQEDKSGNIKQLKKSPAFSFQKSSLKKGTVLHAKK